MIFINVSRLVVGGEVGGVAFGARGRHGATGTQSTLLWVEQEEALRPDY